MNGYIDGMRTRDRRLRRAIQGLGALALALCSGVSMALGLGDIRVLSRPGQPLLAEIPVISNEPGELDNARVALASAETFARVGLERPEGLDRDLQFTFARDGQGRAVICVTSTAPVQAPSLSFLIEVDWGQGRLVREYSALIDAPVAAVAPAAAIEAPPGVPADRIAPLAEETEAATSRPVPPPAVPASAATSAPAPDAGGDRPAPGENLPAVRAGQTLSEIALGLARGSGYSLDQTMIALLQANPQAFIDGNIHRLRQGAILRTPRQAELERIGAAEARALVRAQTAQWRQARAAIPQPAVAGVGEGQPSSAATRTATGDARLEIAPAVAGRGQGKAGTVTGTTPGGEGDMADTAELRQAREDLASREAELQELRARVEALEKLQKQQQALIALKDSELAAASQRLADARGREGEGLAGWLWGVLALGLAGAGAWVLARRRKPSPLPPLRGPGPVDGPLPATEPAVVAEAPTADLPEETSGGVATPPAAEASSASEAAASDTPVSVPDETAEAHALRPLNPAPAGRERLELALAYRELGDVETARSLLAEVARGPDPQAREEAVRLLGELG